MSLGTTRQALSSSRWVSLGISAYSLQVLTSPYQQFEGTWKAVQDGNAFIVLQLRDERGHPSGSVELASFQMDLRGARALVKVTDKKLDPPIKLQNIKLDANTLSFDFVDSDGDDDKWTMDLTGANRASFLWVGLPKELKPTPLILTKETNADPKTE